ncbi:MAG TPA: hypothetical protein VHL58_07345 [Thermoanaerobaculia bacterium]|nr:hypothetical protein [Thermoanaerobaculia bacterium]
MKIAFGLGGAVLGLAGATVLVLGWFFAGLIHAFGSYGSPNSALTGMREIFQTAAPTLAVGCVLLVFGFSLWLMLSFPRTAAIVPLLVLLIALPRGVVESRERWKQLQAMNEAVAKAAVPIRNAHKNDPVANRALDDLIRGWHLHPLVIGWALLPVLPAGGFLVWLPFPIARLRRREQPSVRPTDLT